MASRFKFNYITEEEDKIAARECEFCKVNYADEDIKNWEKLNTVASRAFKSIEKYLKYDK